MVVPMVFYHLWNKENVCVLGRGINVIRGDSKEENLTNKMLFLVVLKWKGSIVKRKWLPFGTFLQSLCIILSHLN